MTIVPLGVTYPEGAPLVPPQTSEMVALNAAQGESHSVASQSGRLTPLLRWRPAFRLDLAPTKAIDMTNPAEAGWTIVVAEEDPRRARLLDVVRPLVHHRGMREPPLEFPAASDGRRREWVGSRYPRVLRFFTTEIPGPAGCPRCPALLVAGRAGRELRNRGAA
jgi:hypothetical protein